MIRHVMFCLGSAFSLQAMQFEGSLVVNPMAEKTGTPFVLLLMRPFVSEDFITRRKPVTFLLTVSDLVNEELLDKHVIVEAELIGVDQSCFLPTPIIQVQEITEIKHPEDWDEEYPDFIPYISKIMTAGVDLMLWKSWLSGYGVISGRDGFVIETLSDGREIVKSNYINKKSECNESVYIQKVNSNNELLIALYKEALSRETMQFVNVSDQSKLFEESTSKDGNSFDEYLAVSDCYMIYSHGIACGYIQYSIHERKIACIEEFFIERSFRRQGIGEKTFKALECHLRRQEIDSIHLTVLEANQPAFKLYQKMGFVIRSSFNENDETGFLMQKNIPTL